MTLGTQLSALTIDAHEPVALAQFWAGVLGRAPANDGPLGVHLVPDDDRGFPIRFQPTAAAKVVANRMHFDLTSASLTDQQAIVDRALDLGGRHIDVGQRPEEGHVVLADPEGNELCVLPPGNNFTAGCGTIGALSCDGSQAVGYFWAAALGWPLVWDQDEETAIQSPRGGPKIAWGGPPVEPKAGKARWHLDLTPLPGGDVRAEVERLVGLGARQVDIGQGEVGWVVLADPDDNEFCVVPNRQPR